MKRYYLLILVTLGLCGVQAQEFKLATYNIRHTLPTDTGVIKWEKRQIPVINLIQYHGFAIFGVQEAYHVQLVDLSKAFPNFAYIGLGREDGKQAGEHTAIFYDTNLFEVVEHGNFWLSDSDITTVNRGWDAAVERNCTWAVFKLIGSGKQFIYMNTHFDHKGSIARLESAKLLLKMAEQYGKGLPVVLSGDFNFPQDTAPYAVLAQSGRVQDSFERATLKYQPNSTFNGFGRFINESARIDHIFLSSEFKVSKYAVLTDTYMGRFPSDHFPVMINVEL